MRFSYDEESGNWKFEIGLNCSKDIAAAF